MGWICRCCRLENDLEQRRCVACGTEPRRGQVAVVRAEVLLARGGRETLSKIHK